MGVRKEVSERRLASERVQMPPGPRPHRVDDHRMLDAVQRLEAQDHLSLWSILFRMRPWSLD